MSGTGKLIIQLLVGVLVIALVGGIIAVVYRYTNGFNEEFKTFYVEYDGKQILTESSEMMTFEADTAPKFTVKYTFDGENAEPKDYSVKVLPNKETDFEYTVDGNKHLYSKTKELTAAFGIEKSSTSFTLTLTHEMNIRNVLREANGSTDVKVPKIGADIAQPYVLVVSSYNDKVTYNIKFGINGTDEIPPDPVDPDDNDSHGMSLDITSIVF